MNHEQNVSNIFLFVAGPNSTPGQHCLQMPISMVDQQSTDHQNDPGHAVTGRGRHHDESEATHDQQLQVGSPAPRNHIHSPRCVLLHGTGNVGLNERCSLEVKSFLQRPRASMTHLKDNPKKRKLRLKREERKPK